MPKHRNVPDCPSEPPGCVVKGERREFQIELQTPMFGGGVEAGRPDMRMPIRATSIRGQLQFWWRATVGAQYKKKEELREAQSRIWGSTERASRVVVGVESVDSTQMNSCDEFMKYYKGSHRNISNTHKKEQRAGPSLPYVLFPFRNGLSGRRCQDGGFPIYVHRVRFGVTIKCSEDVWADVEPAVWAWVNFGGLGARTRRGCGALWCEEFAPADENSLRRGPEQAWESHGIREWPTLSLKESVFIGKRVNSAIEAWDSVIGLMRDFRQGEGLGRNHGGRSNRGGGGNRPGRSCWPEPETIRRVTGKRASKHQRLKDIPDNAFPRAELGLPIVFHFQGNGEPPDTVLYPGDAGGNRLDRMASPLILRPLMFKDRTVAPMVLRLKTPVLERVDLRYRDGHKSIKFLKSPVIRTQYENSPMKDYSCEGSALEAFMAYAKKEMGIQ